MLNKYPLAPLAVALFLFVVGGTIIHGLPILIYCGLWAAVFGSVYLAGKVTA